MSGLGRDRPVLGHRTAEGRTLHERGPARPVSRLHPGIGHQSRTEAAEPGPAWWPGVRRGLPSLGVSLLLLAFGMTLLYWRGPMGGAVAPELVVWRVPGQETVTLSAVDRGDWQAFLASRHAARAQARQAILAEAHSEMMTALAPLFEEMKGRVKDYVGWFYFFPTSYRMAFTAVGAALSKKIDGDNRAVEQRATDALNLMLQDRFLELVVIPEKFGPAVEAQARAVETHAIERAEAGAAAETAALATFMAAHGHPAPAGGESGTGQPVVVSWEALRLPAPASAMAAPPDAVALIKADPSFSGLQTTATAEGMVLVARQIARRTVNSVVANAARATVLPMVAGSALGPAEGLLGFAAFGIGVGAEFGAVKMRETVEGDRLTELSTGIVDHLRETQSAVLADGVTHRVDTWLGAE